jgi:serine/threonine-protein kinase
MSAETLFAGRYRLERRLGVGGMATVQLAMDTRLERYVAVKLLAEHLAEDRNFVSRFRREALSVARLIHPNIVQVYDFGTDERSGRQYIAMEYVDGSSCAELLRELGRLEPGEAVDILTQACRGLAYAHRNGVVHRDVKPGNLLRSRDAGQLKLADFGIAKAAEQSDITKVGSVLGTAAYLAPEQARGQPAGPQSDLYALGVVAYQLLSGRLPYDATSLTDLARQQSAGPPAPLHELDPEIPRGLSLAVERALARDPEDRYADAGEMEHALPEGLRGVPPAGRRGGGADAEDATRPLERTAATRPLTRTAPAQSRRRRLEPVQDAPPSRARRETPPPAPAPRPDRARAPQKQRGGLRRLFSLLLLLAVVAAGVVAYSVVSDASDRGVQLKEQVQGDAEQAVQEIQELIEDNVR